MCWNGIPFLLKTTTKAAISPKLWKHIITRLFGEEKTEPARMISSIMHAETTPFIIEVVIP